MITLTTDQIIKKVTDQWVQTEYAMYLRKSRADVEMEALGEGETLARHQHMLEALAAKHEITLDQITVYREVVSGDSISERPEMQRLLSDVYAKKYKGVFVVEVERLARGNTKDQGEVADAFQVSDTKIITPMKVYNPNDEFDQEYFEFGLFMSRREYKTIKRRLEAGKYQSFKEGNYMLPQRIYGFDIVRKSKKDRFLVENPEEAKIVRMIFDWFTEDKRTTGWIAKQLTLMGIPTMKKQPEWNRGTIRDMLANVHYIGLVWWNKHNTVKEFDAKAGKLVKVRKKNEAPETAQGKHKGIISVEQFEKAQALMNKQTQSPVNVSTELVNPLAGLMVCCDCGKHMKLQRYPNDNKESRYTHARSMVCTKKSITCDVVVSALVDALKAYETDFEIKMKNDHGQAERIRHAEQVEAMETELAKQERKRRSLFDSFEEGLYTKDEFIERKQRYNQTIEAIKKQIQEAKMAVPAPVDYSEQIVNIHAMIDCLRDQEISAKDKNDFLKQYMDIIKYDSVNLGHKKGARPVLDVYLK